MQPILILSILIRGIAVVWSGVLLRSLRDWRMAFLTVTLALMALRQTLTLLAGPRSYGAAEWPGLFVSVAALIAVAHLGRIIRERRKVEERLEERARQQAIVAKIGQVALEAHDQSQLMQEIVEVLVQTLEVDFAKILQLRPDGELALVAGVGWRDGYVGRATVAADSDSQAGYTLRVRQPVVLTDAATERRFKLSALLREHGVAAGMSVVIEGHDGPFGVLGVHTKEPRAFSAKDAYFLESMANVLAAAIQRERTERALRDSNERLRQSQKMEAIGQLAGGVAHDFNNLLTAIIGYAEVVEQQSADNRPTRRAAQEIRQAADRAASLTQQLLAFGRRQVLQPTLLRINDVVLDIERMLRRLIGEDIDLVTLLKPGLPVVLADRGQLQQALLNLAINARDAMACGGKLVVETRELHVQEEQRRGDARIAPGSYVVVSVADTGCGMDRATQGRVFEPFFTTKEEKGTGLGLSTVYGIAKQSGGYIWVTSEPEQGTTFELWLPIADEGLRVTPPDLGQTLAAKGAETILLVEDDEAVRALTRDVLQTNGYTVLEAPGGPDAVCIGERYAGPIHLLLTDVVMPQMSGRQVVEHLGRLHPDMKVLYMSGYPTETLGRHGVMDTEISLLNKPFTPASLANKVRETLEAAS